ncbi:MAG TPA: VanZ family protein [Planctomycetota bacterium]|nr:VanZ family protein [Planctomycetota bacterium]
MIEPQYQKPAQPLRGIDSALRAWLQRPQRLRAAVPLIIMALLWWSSSGESLLGGPSFGVMLVHNSMHGIAYAALGGSLLLALTEGTTRLGGAAIAPAAWSVAIATVYGALDEVHQSYVQGRVCSIADFLADVCGAAAAVAFLRARLYEDRASAVAFPFCILALVASVVLGTAGPW